MKKVIYKYPLFTAAGYQPEIEIVMPYGAQILSVQKQQSAFGRGAYLWALVPGEAPMAQTRNFRLIMTGEELSNWPNLHYLATVQTENGIVMHIFEDVWAARTVKLEEADERKTD
jgi:hypothetical protein